MKMAVNNMYLSNGRHETYPFEMPHFFRSDVFGLDQALHVSVGYVLLKSHELCVQYVILLMMHTVLFCFVLLWL